MNFLLNLPDVKNGEEVFETIENTKSFVIERIVSNNAVSPAKGWHEQPTDEWVMVLQGSATIETEQKTYELHTGDTCFLKAMQKHKVIYTSAQPVCVWLAVHEKNEDVIGK